MANLPEVAKRRRGRPPKPISTELVETASELEYEEIDMTPEPKSNESTMGRKVSRVVFHTGIQVGMEVRNSLDEVRNNVKMSLCEHGILITRDNGEQMVVGMADILSAKLA